MCALLFGVNKSGVACIMFTCIHLRCYLENHFLREVITSLQHKMFLGVVFHSIKTISTWCLHFVFPKMLSGIKTQQCCLRED